MEGRCGWVGNEMRQEQVGVQKWNGPVQASLGNSHLSPHPFPNTHAAFMGDPMLSVWSHPAPSPPCSWLVRKLMPESRCPSRDLYLPGLG